MINNFFKKLKFPLVAAISLIVVSLACGGSDVTSPPVVSTQEESEQTEIPPTERLDVTSIPPTLTPEVPTVPPTPSNPPLEFLSHQSFRRGGWFQIVGEVRNNTDSPMESVKIVVTLYDNNESVVGTDFFYTILDVIPPGGKSPFKELWTAEWAAGTTSYKIQAQGSESSFQVHEPVIISHKSYIEIGYFHIVGEVQNNTDSPMVVEIVVTLYDNNESVVDTDLMITQLDTIPPGGKSPFKGVWPVDWVGTSSYKLQAQGRESSYEPPVPVIISHQSYIDDGRFHVVGEVQNNTDIPMDYVTIIVTLYDDNESVVDTISAYTSLYVIPPGGKSPFDTWTDEWAGTTSYAVQSEGHEGTLPRQDLVIRSHESYIDGNWFHVRGEVENTGTTDAEEVKIIVTLYDVSGNVVGLARIYTALDAGETSPFECRTDHWPNFDHYEIQVQRRW